MLSKKCFRYTVETPSYLIQVYSLEAVLKCEHGARTFAEVNFGTCGEVFVEFDLKARASPTKLLSCQSKRYTLGDIY